MSASRIVPPPGRGQIELLDGIPSTNDAARDRAIDGAPDGACVVADTQTAGRGRHGRLWFSPPGCNLYLSLVVRAASSRIRLLPLLGAVATREVVAAYLDGRTRATIKWPNDVLADGLKVAGVLAELYAGDEPFGILGIGVNVNMGAHDFPADLRRPAGSLSMLLGREVDRSELLANLLDRLDRWRGRLDDDPAGLVSAVRLHCSTLGCRVAVRPPSAEGFDGVARAIEDDGVLVVEDRTGRLVRVEAGDVDPFD